MHRLSGLQLRALSINTLTQFIVRIIGSVTTLATTLLVAYFLGIASVGSFTKVIAFVSIFYLAVDFGFNSILLKKYFPTVEEKIGNLTVLRLAIAIILIPIIAIITLLLPFNPLDGTGFSNVEKMAIVIYSFTLVGVSFNNSLQAYLQKKLIYHTTIIPSIIANSLLLVIVLFASFTGNFNLIFAGYIFYWGVLSLTTFIILKKNEELSLSVHQVRHFSKSLLLSSWPLGLMLLFNLLYSRVDVFALSFLRPTEDVGAYGVSYRFFEVAIALPTFLANSTYPILLRHMNKPSYQPLFAKYIKLYIVLSLLVVFASLVLSPLVGLLKNDFALSIVPLQILSLSLPFFFLTSLFQWHFLIKDKLHFLVPLYCIALLLNLLLNVIFIPHFSFYAAAVITGVCELLVFIAMLWYFKRTV